MNPFFIILFTLLYICNSSAQPVENCDCDYTINSWYWKFDGQNIGNMPNVTIHDSIVAAAHPLSNVKHNDSLALLPGDVICVDASIPYRFLTWENIIGDSINPIIIKNVGGQVVIRSLIASYGWKFKNSQYFKVLGNGDPNHKYGFKVTTHFNSYIQMINKTSDFEIAHVEIAGDFANGLDSLSGFAGIMAKSQPICGDDVNGGSTDAANFEMKNVSIHHNYIHDVAGEGMYVGYGRAQGVQLNSSSGDVCSTVNYPHHVRNLFIYNNIIENVGWDGIQVKNAHYNAQIYNNIIKNYATLGIGHHDEGILIGDGTEAVIYGNWIEGGNEQSNGMQINAFGNTKIYNNVVLKPGSNGLYLNNQSLQFANRAGTIDIYNNTIEGGTGSAIVTHTQQNVNIKNNIAFEYDAYHGIKNPTNGSRSHNIIEKDKSNVGFMNYGISDVRLNTNSLAVNTAQNNVSFTQYDFTGALRTDSLTDKGALEYGSVINTTDINIMITTPALNVIPVNLGQSMPIKASLKDVNNKVRKVEYYLNNKKIGTDFMPNKTEHVIGNQHFKNGNNIFKIKIILYGGESVYSDSITFINSVPTPIFKENKAISNPFKFQYNAINQEFIIDKSHGINVKNIAIYDLLGKRIEDWTAIDNTNTIIRKKITHSIFGIYIMSISTDQGMFSKKILIPRTI